MLNRMLVSISMTLLAVCWTSSSCRAQSDVVPIPTVPGKPGYVVVEEDRWYLMSDEPGQNIGRAREALLMSDLQTAAKELRKAAIHLKIAASDSAEKTRRKLIRSEKELEKTAERVQDNAMKTIDEFDVITARALHALSEYHYIKAEQAWQKKKTQQAGHYLKASADNIERAAAHTEARFKATTGEIARESRAISGKLIDGTSVVVDDVGSGITRIGHQIERLETKVIPQATDR